MKVRPNSNKPAKPSKPAEAKPQQEAKPHPKDDGVFTVDDIICPVQRTGFVEGDLIINSKGEVQNLPEFLEKVAGTNCPMTGIANHAAKRLSNGGSHWKAFWAEDSSYNVQDLAGSSLDHNADSQILRNGFSQERLDKALSFSSDGSRLTFEDLKSYQKELLREEPGKSGEIFGGAEFTLLVEIFGDTDASGQKFIKNDDFVSLFKDNRWPKGWVRPEENSTGILGTVAAVKEYFEAEGRPLPPDSEEPTPSAPAEAKPAGVCPFGHGQGFEIADSAKHRQE